MGNPEVFRSNLLKIELQEDEKSVHVRWSGKSTHRKPSQFVTPLLLKAFKKSGETEKRVILDFRELDYMNSSTITPVIKILERAKRGKNKVSILYEKSLKWQDLNFSALDLFQTNDGRVQIRGL